MIIKPKRRTHFARILPQLLCLCLFSSLARADTEYYRHILFDNSLEPDAYYYSDGKASSPSTLELAHGKLPVSRDLFFTPPNALRLKWRSVLSGGWEASVRAMDFRNREINFHGDVLYFWCYSQEGIGAAELPLIRLSDIGHNFSGPLELGRFLKALPAKGWVQVAIPLHEFSTGSIRTFEANRTATIIFGQNAADAAEHSLIIDEIKIDGSTAAAGDTSEVDSSLPTPQNVSAKGYERHVDISWDPVDSAELQRYIIYRSLDGQGFRPVGIQVPGVNRHTDFLGNPGQTAHYKVAASDNRYRASALSEEANATTKVMSDDELLTMLQETCFRYYWEGAHPIAGATLENIPGDDRIVATGASGFGIMALVVELIVASSLASRGWTA